MRLDPTLTLVPDPAAIVRHHSIYSRALPSTHDLTITAAIASPQVQGVRTFFGISFRCRAAVLTTGTFMNGRIWVGRMSMPAGRWASARWLVVSYASVYITLRLLLRCLSSLSLRCFIAGSLVGCRNIIWFVTGAAGRFILAEH